MRYYKDCPHKDVGIFVDFFAQCDIFLAPFPSIAQSVEQRPFKPTVVGSNPTGRTKLNTSRDYLS